MIYMQKSTCFISLIRCPACGIIVYDDIAHLFLHEVNYCKCINCARIWRRKDKHIQGSPLNLLILFWHDDWSSLFKNGKKTLGAILFQFANMAKKNRTEDNTFLLMFISTLEGKSPHDLDPWLSLISDCAWQLLAKGVRVNVPIDIPEFGITKGIIIIILLLLFLLLLLLTFLLFSYLC